MSAKKPPRDSISRKTSLYKEDLKMAVFSKSEQKDSIT
jgi:hypothetical protein